ncbi:unnamed protein product [Auanema sp. JU1783]|nr:unnamed protein product [Auanema sp. JU1783]
MIKGKPRGRTVKISSGLIIGVEHKKKRAVGRPIKTPRGRNAKVKRDLLTKEGFRLPKLPAIPNPQHSKSYVNYKAVKIDI